MGRESAMEFCDGECSGQKRTEPPSPAFVANAIRLLVFAALLWAALPGAARGSSPDIALMAPSSLNDQSERWIVLDARPVTDWRRERLPGALSFTWEDHVQSESGGGSYLQPTPQRLASALGNLGLTESSPVVVYGDLDRSWGGEGWVVWVLAWLGHQGPIRLLDGGVQAWKNQGFSLVSGDERRPLEPRTYSVNLRDELNVQAGELDDRGRPWVVVDTRSSIEWLTGRLPNAVHIPWTDFFNGRERRPLGGVELSRLLRRHGIDPEAPVVFYCTAGVRSAFVWTVYALAGSRTARNYSGGVSDWREFTRKSPSRRGA